MIGFSHVCGRQDQTSWTTDDQLPRIQDTGLLCWTLALQTCWAHTGHSNGPANAFQTGDEWMAAGAFCLYSVVSRSIMKVVCVCSAVRGTVEIGLSPTFSCFLASHLGHADALVRRVRRKVIPLQSPQLNHEFASGHHLTVHARHVSPRHCRPT